MNQRSPKEGLLDEARETLEVGPTSTPSPNGAIAQDAAAPTSSSRYVVVEEFARGGLGRILKAYDERLDRPVAIKEMLESGDSVVLRERFERETAITARLQHPAIVPIYDAGRRPGGGPPFYVMKLLGNNRTLGQAIAQAASLKERLVLLPNVIAVADAIAYAHSLDIIHRDIKPSNVLLGPFGETVVIDWGLAKELSRSAPADPLCDAPYRSAAPGVTSIGSVMGTPHYMAPEQARGESVDARADVYSLGALLYHVLCGAPPFGELSSRDALDRLVAAPPPPLVDKAPGVPADLVAVVAKAMERDPAQRYRDASELTGDLKRFAAGQLVGAHHYSPGALLWRWLHRYRLPAAVALIFLLTLVVVGAASVRRIRSERAVAVSQRNALILAQAAGALESDPTLALEWLKTYPASGAEWDRAQVLAADAESRGVARHIVPTMATMTAMSSDGASVLTAGPDALVKVWRIADGAKLAAGSFGAPVLAARFAPDGQSIAVCTRSGDVVSWTPSSDCRTRLVHLDGGAFYVYYSADGRSLAVSGLKSVVVWDLTAGRPIWQTSTPEAVTVLGLSRDGATVAFGTVDGTLHLVDVAQGAVRRLAGHVGAINSFDFSRDGKRLLSGGMDHTIRLWDVASGANRLVGAHDGLIRDVRFSPTDPNLAASGGADFKVRLWRLDGGGARVFAGHTDIVDDIAFSPDGRTLASCSPDWRVRLWDVATGDVRVLLGHRGVLGDSRLHARRQDAGVVGIRPRRDALLAGRCAARTCPRASRSRGGAGADLARRSRRRLVRHRSAGAALGFGDGRRAAAARCVVCRHGGVERHLLLRRRHAAGGRGRQHGAPVESGDGRGADLRRAPDDAAPRGPVHRRQAPRRHRQRRHLALVGSRFGTTDRALGTSRRGVQPDILSWRRSPRLRRRRWHRPPLAPRHRRGARSRSAWRRDLAAGVRPRWKVARVGRKRRIDLVVGRRERSRSPLLRPSRHHHRAPLRTGRSLAGVREPGQDRTRLGRRYRPGAPAHPA